LLSKIRLLVLLLILNSSLAQGFTQPAEHYGFLKIKSDSANLEIFIDNKLAGKTPLQALKLKPGKYVLSVNNPLRYLWGHFDYEKEIEIFPFDTLVVSPDFSSGFSIRTKPYGAEIYINNQLAGKSPLTLFDQELFHSDMLIKKEGFKDLHVDFNQFQMGYLNIVLEKDDEIFNINKLKEKHRQTIKSRYRKATYTLWAASILTGMASFYLKSQADENYQKYLSSGSLNKMNSYYDSAIRYDNYTNISLAAFQGCIILSLYFFIKSID